MQLPAQIAGPRRLVIIGAGGFGSEAAWVAAAMGAAWQLEGFADDDAARHGLCLGAHPVLGGIEHVAARFAGEPLSYFCAMGNNHARERAAARADARGWSPATLIHPSAIVAPGAVIGSGSYLGPASVVCPNARLGAHVIVNVHASVGHDSRLGDFAQICPGARISGCCQVGSLALVGSNATLLPGIAIGCGAVAGANSQIAAPLDPYTTAAGVPARVICKRPPLAAPAPVPEAALT